MNRYRLADAITDMASRIANSMHRAGLAYAGNGTHSGKPHAYYYAAAERQQRALRRLTRALLNAEVSR